MTEEIGEQGEERGRKKGREIGTGREKERYDSGFVRAKEKIMRMDFDLNHLGCLTHFVCFSDMNELLAGYKVGVTIC